MKHICRRVRATAARVTQTLWELRRRGVNVPYVGQFPHKAVKAFWLTKRYGGRRAREILGATHGQLTVLLYQAREKRNLRLKPRRSYSIQDPKKEYVSYA